MDHKSLLNSLQANGYARVNGFVSGDQLTQLQREFERFYTTKDLTDLALGRDRIDCDNLRFELKNLPAQEVAVTKALFSSDWMRELAAEYLDNDDILLNHEIFVCRHYPNTGHRNDLPYVFHFDRIRTFKFFIYLNDVDINAGPIEIIPGSHILNRKNREDHMKQGLPLEEFKNVIETVDRCESLTAKAGDLVIFDTDVTHRAGFVEAGNERHVLRGHTRDTATYKYFNHGSRKNIKGFLKKVTGFLSGH